jgi:hypothetical protein
VFKAKMDEFMNPRCKYHGCVDGAYYNDYCKKHMNAKKTSDQNCQHYIIDKNGTNRLCKKKAQVGKNKCGIHCK